MRYLFLGLLLILGLTLYSQEHHHPEFEIGLSNGLVYNFTEKEVAFGLHLHAAKTIGHSDKFGLGLGYEIIFDDHKHNTISLILLYRPIEYLSISLSPGVAFKLSEQSSIAPALHIEGLYEFEFDHFHIGPQLGFALSTEDIHGSIGLHIAIGF